MFKMTEKIDKIKTDIQGVKPFNRQLKKSSRAGFLTLLALILCLSSVLGVSKSFASPVSETPPPKVPILLYHHFDPKKQSSSVVVSPEKFEQDLLAIKAAGYTTIHFSQLISYLDKGEPLPVKPIIITMDDGYTSNYRYAYPLLKKHKMKASMFVIGWSAGKSSFEESDEEINPHFTWQEAGEMASSGLVEIQNHSYDLHSMAGLSAGQGLKVGQGVSRLPEEDLYTYASRLVLDLRQNNDLITKATGQKPSIFAYPMGVRTLESDWLVQDSDLYGSVTTEKGVRYYHTLADLRAMPRLNVDMSITSKTLIKWIEKQPIK